MSWRVLLMFSSRSSSGLWSTLNLLLYKVKESKLILHVDILFCQHYLLNRLSFIKWMFLPLSKLNRHSFLSLLLGPLFYSNWYIFFLCQYQTVFISIALQYNLRLACVLLWVHINACISKLMNYDTGTLINISLNL